MYNILGGVTVVNTEKFVVNYHDVQMEFEGFIPNSKALPSRRFFFFDNTTVLAVSIVGLAD